MTETEKEERDWEFRQMLKIDAAHDEPEPTDEEEHDYWNGAGHIEFFVIQNVLGDFEIEVTDCSGCAGGLQETIGIDYYLKEYWGLQNELREGVTYTLHNVTVYWTRGDGWTYDDDVEYNFDSMTSHATAIGYLSYKIHMIWWRAVGSRIRNFIRKNKR